MNPYDAGTWRDFEKEHFTIEERAAMTLRVNLICKLIEARNKQNFTQRDLAEKTGFTQAAIARIERCKTFPNVNTLLKILTPLGYALDIVPLQDSTAHLTA